MIKKLFRKVLFGWRIEFHKKLTKRKNEYQLRIWKPIKKVKVITGLIPNPDMEEGGWE